MEGTKGAVGEWSSWAGRNGAMQVAGARATAGRGWVNDDKGLDRDSQSMLEVRLSGLAGGLLRTLEDRCLRNRSEA